jgi:hypothetical protein
MDMWVVIRPYLSVPLQNGHRYVSEKCALASPHCWMPWQHLSTQVVGYNHSLKIPGPIQFTQSLKNSEVFTYVDTLLPIFIWTENLDFNK